MFWKLSQIKNVFANHVNTQTNPAKTPIIPAKSPIQNVPVQKAYVKQLHGSLIVTSSKHNDSSSHVLLKMGFCCTEHNGVFLVKNHASYIYDCKVNGCHNCLVKVPIGIFN